MTHSRENNLKEFEQPKAGTYRVACVGVFDLGLQENTYEGKTNRNYKILYLFEIDQKDSNGIPFMGFLEFNNILPNKTNIPSKLPQLFEFLRIWTGEDKFSDFDHDLLIGRCGIGTMQNKKGKVYLSKNLSPLMSGMEPYVPKKTYLDEPPAWVQKKIDKQIVEHSESTEPSDSIDSIPDEDIPF